MSPISSEEVNNTVLSKEEQLKRYLYVEAHRPGGDPTQILELLEDIVDDRAWEKLGIGLSDFISETYPAGAAVTLKDFKTMVFDLSHRYESTNSDVRERMKAMRDTVRWELNPELSKHGGDRVSEEDQGSITTLIDRGASYTLRRLKRDRPDLAEEVLSGELSANAAAIEAGFRKKTLTVTLEPRSIARTLTRHLSEDQINDLIVELADGAR